jgi:hypothetical protein
VSTAIGGQSALRMEIHERLGEPEGSMTVTKSRNDAQPAVSQDALPESGRGKFDDGRNESWLAFCEFFAYLAAELRNADHAKPASVSFTQFPTSVPGQVCQHEPAAQVRDVHWQTALEERPARKQVRPKNKCQ